MRVEIIRRKFCCPVCKKVFVVMGEAALCLKQHKDGYAKNLPPYQVGSRVKTIRFNDSHYGVEETKIIRLRGQFLDLVFLVENGAGERYWVRAVSYQVIDFEKDPAPFRFVSLA